MPTPRDKGEAARRYLGAVMREAGLSIVSDESITREVIARIRQGEITAERAAEIAGRIYLEAEKKGLGTGAPPDRSSAIDADP